MTRSLDFAPGARSAYSNFGYSLLGRIVATTRRTTYLGKIKADILDRLNITRAVLGTSVGSPGGEPRYEFDGFGDLARSVVHADRRWTPWPYGGWNLTNMDSHGGWVMAAADLARIVGSLDLRGAHPKRLLSTTQQSRMLQDKGGGVADGWFRDSWKGRAAVMHNGSLAGTSCLIYRRSDEVSFVVLLNREVSGMLQATHGRQLSDLADSVTTWPTTDLFPSVGLPSY